MFDQKTRINIGKLVALLTSDKDGEVLAAARAIERRLLATNHSIHDLVLLITGCPLLEHIDDTKHSDRVKYCINNREYLKDKEKEFIASLAAKFKFNPSYKLSDKQSQWLGSIFTRVRLLAEDED